MVVDSVIKTYIEKEGINKIINKLKNIRFDNLRKPEYYEMSLLKRGTKEEDVKNIYPQFERIGLIHERRLKYGDIGYDLHYELEDGTFFIIAICIEKKLLINAFHAQTNFKNFKRSVLKSYKENSY